MKRTAMQYTANVGAAIGLILCLGVSSRVRGGSVKDVSWLKNKCNGGGAVAWHKQSQSDIKLFDVATGKTMTIGNGGRHEFSPDGSKIAWMDGGTAKGCMWKQSPNDVHNIISGCDYNSGVHWLSNTEVVVNKGGKWYKVHISGSPQSEVSALSKLGKVEFEGDVKLCGDGVWSWVSGDRWKTSDGKSGSSPGHCSRSLSPDGRSVTGLEHDHNACTLKRIRSGGVDTRIYRTVGNCGSKGFDNQRWASSDKNFIVAQWECENKVGVWEVGSSDACIVGSSGGETYGDMTTGDGSGDPWPGTGAVDPKAVIDNPSVSFSAVEGAEAPNPKTINVYTEAGELQSVSISGAPSWLSVSKSASSGQEITLTNTPSIDGLTADTYSATITVSTSNAGNITYTVNLTVTKYVPPPAIEVTSPNGGESYALGQTITITWKGVVDSLSRGVNLFVSTDDGKSWLSINLEQSIEPGAAGWESYSWKIPAEIEGVSLISTSCRIKVEDYDEGTGRADQSDGTFTIRDPSAVHLKLNCGGSKHAVSGWDNAGTYATGGEAYDFGEDGLTSGVSNAAPAGVYRTCRHRIKGQETGFSYTIPSLTDGGYIVRLHFADKSTRSIDVSIEGQQVVSDLNITGQAGGDMKALVIEKEVTVSGGSMEIELNDDGSSPADVLINGIEVMYAGVPVKQTLAPSGEAGQPSLSARVTAGGAIRIVSTVERPHAIRLRSLDGRTIMATAGAGAARMLLQPGDLPAGFYLVEATWDGGSTSIGLRYMARP